MYTDHSCQSFPWTPSKHPPPSKPLPPLPSATYFMLPEPVCNRSLLLHPVPSPSLRFDMMALSFGPASCARSSQSFSFPYTSRRDSTSSIGEFVQSLLPPTPTSIQPHTAGSPVECRLQKVQNESIETPSMSPISKRGATPDQLHRLRSDLVTLNMKRRDSATFDVTQAKQSSIRLLHTEVDFRNTSPPIPSPGYTAYVPNFESNGAESIYRPHFPGPVSQIQVTSEEETSFIDWDDEVPRLAKMKKSIADLRPANRVRANSSPLVPTRSSPSSASTTSATFPDPLASTTRASYRLSQTCSPTIRPCSPSKSAKRKSFRRRRTIFLAGNARRCSQLEFKQTVSSATVPTLSSKKRKRSSTVVSGNTSHRRNGLNRLTCWMKKVMKCS